MVIMTKTKSGRKNGPILLPRTKILILDGYRHIPYILYVIYTCWGGTSSLLQDTIHTVSNSMKNTPGTTIR